MSTMEQRIDEFIEMFEDYEELNLGGITKGIVKDALLAWVNNPRQNGVDTLIRHKWPEEKPVEEKSYLTRVEINGVVSFLEMYWSEQLGWHTRYGKRITHWWDLRR